MKQFAVILCLVISNLALAQETIEHIDADGNKYVVHKSRPVRTHDGSVVTTAQEKFVYDKNGRRYKGASSHTTKQVIEHYNDCLGFNKSYPFFRFTRWPSRLALCFIQIDQK